MAGGRPCPAGTAPAHSLGPPGLNGEAEAGPSLGSGCEVLSSVLDNVYCPLPHRGALTGCFRTSVLNSFTPDLPAAVRKLCLSAAFQPSAPKCSFCKLPEFNHDRDAFSGRAVPFPFPRTSQTTPKPNCRGQPSPQTPVAEDRGQ